MSAVFAVGPSSFQFSRISVKEPSVTELQRERETVAVAIAVFDLATGNGTLNCGTPAP